MRRRRADHRGGAVKLRTPDRDLMAITPHKRIMLALIPTRLQANQSIRPNSG